MESSVAVGNQLRLQRRIGPGGSVLKLSGIIDDSFNRAQLVEGARGITVLDLDGVTRITSYGVREWMAALKSLPQEYYCFINCRPVVVAQFNMINGFAGGGQLVSFYAPYACPDCGKSIDVLIDLRTQYAELPGLDGLIITCPECRVAAEFDDLPESYFSYVLSSPQPAPPPLANAFIGGDPAAFATPLRIEKEVTDALTLFWLSGTLDKGARFKRLADGLEGHVVMVMADVPSATESGLAGLTTFLHSPGLELYFARVPLNLARWMAGSPDVQPQARVVSVNLPIVCNACQQPSVQEVAATLLKSEPPRIPLQCPNCLKPAQLNCAPQHLAQLRSLQLVEAPGPIDEALRARRTGLTPSFSEARTGSHSGPLPTRAAPTQGGEGTELGRYQLLKRLGAGGMAEIFLARQHGPMGFEKKVVLKRILPHLVAREQFVTMFLEEARLAARISHPNVVQIFDLGEVGGQYFIAMEYVRGWDLALLLKLATSHGQLPLPVACRLVADICAGLHAAHTCADENGELHAIIHRDVSPHNVLVSKEGVAKLTDFGIAKAVKSTSNTDPGVVKGKFAYMAPENFGAKGNQVDARSDVFAAGVILFQCLTLHSPFRRDNEASTMYAILHAPLPKPTTYRPDVPPQLEAIVARALARNPDARYPTAKALQQDLERYLAQQPSSAEGVAEWLEAMMRKAEGAGEESDFPIDVSLTPSEAPTDAADQTPTLQPGSERRAG